MYSLMLKVFDLSWETRISYVHKLIRIAYRRGEHWDFPPLARIPPSPEIFRIINKVYIQ